MQVCGGGVYNLLDKEWWSGRRKRIQIKRKKLRCQYTKCRSRDVVGWRERKYKRKRSVRRYNAINVAVHSLEWKGSRGVAF